MKEQDLVVQEGQGQSRDYVDVRGVHPLFVSGQRACSLRVPGSLVPRDISVSDALQIAKRLNP